MSPDHTNPKARFRFVKETERVTISYEGTLIVAPEGVSVAAALLAAELPAGRQASVSGSQRSAYCGIGHCFECTMIIDGAVCRQTCMERVREGMHVARQAV